MTYTAWDYRKLAEYHEQLGNAIIAKHYLAFADTLEENARLTRECEFHAKQCARVDELRHRAEAELAKLRQHAEAMAYCCEALEMALTKAASIYAVRVTLNIEDFLPLTKAYVTYRADFPEEK